MKYLNLPLEFKALNDDGTFSGYASIFGNVDLGNEVVERGAFADIVKNDDGKVVVLWQHDSRQPIGVADVTEDAKGLKFEGSLVLEDPTARKARAHMIAKSCRGMSIGYDTLKDSVRDGVRYLESVKLWEISLVTFGMNQLAGVDMVKAMPLFETIRECESYLRDEVGFTHQQAKEFVLRFKKSIIGARDESNRDDSSQVGDVEAKKHFLTYLNSLSEQT